MTFGAQANSTAPNADGSADTDYDFGALREFRDRYIDIDTENCTAALAEFIVSLASAK